MTQTMLNMADVIANELRVKPQQIAAAIRLLDEGASVPFIARYRKEATAGLDDNHLRHLDQRLHYLREMDERRQSILQTIREQGHLTPALETAILSADSKTRLEDLYLPYRPKRQSKALTAKAAGLEPLAIKLWHEPQLNPLNEAAAFIQTEAGIDSAEAALEGARQILMEQFAEEADLVQELRQYLWQHGILNAQGGKAQDSKAQGGKAQKDSAQKYADYLNYQEAIHKIPSHRALALFRGRREGILRLSLNLSDENYGESRIAAYFNIDPNLAAENWLKETIRQTWKLKLASKLELELLNRLRELADEEAIRVFSRNLRDLLLAAPAGAQVTMGLDPGIRTGIKVAIVDATGKLLDYTTVFPLAPHNEWHSSLASLAKLAAKHQVELISIGNGTGSRETERLVAELIKMYPDLHLNKVLTSEAGASVYSASALAAEEFPDLDVSLRGAVSIARRLQDPLAELVKIDPKSIGVGQYQHDLNPTRLNTSLGGVVEDCVNAVGVDVNTASAALLTHVSGLNETLAKNLVSYRDQHGPFQNREELKHITRMGEKTFQQAAGFLRIRAGNNPLDASGVHPEAYTVVEKILAAKKVSLNELLGNQDALKQIEAKAFADEQFGLPTVCDILRELEKPGRDPRPVFKTACFKEGIESIEHLQVGMVLEGVVSNVTNFGAFIDIGVHQDGLVHISAMTNRFIQDPHRLVKAGDIVTVKVTELDIARRRISLSMRLDENQEPIAKPVAKSKPQREERKPQTTMRENTSKKKPAPQKQPLFNTAMADALTKLKSGLEK
jgi:uncharacterized protein